MHISSLGWLTFLLLRASMFPAVAPESRIPAFSHCGQHSATDISTIAPTSPSSTFDEVINRVVEREHLFLAQMRDLRPIVETYLQNLRSDAKGRVSPQSDQYFLGRLDSADNIEVTSFAAQPKSRISRFRKLSRLYSPDFLAPGFAKMIVPDNEFDKKYYNFTLVRSELLGQVRCFVIDVDPRPEARGGRFKGLIWAEDRDYNIVRFNGTYVSPPPDKFYLHFDSWRLNLEPGLWLPIYIYAEESDSKTYFAHIHLKVQTRLWGYDLRSIARSPSEQSAQVLLDSQQTVKDQGGAVDDATTVMDERMPQRQTENDVVERLQKMGLLAPVGDVDKVLENVINTLLMNSNIDLPSDVRCRVLLTAPLESFTIGHTIVVSRGLLDALPDEASLGVVLAHELGHIMLGHRVDTNLVFNDQTFFPDEPSFHHPDSHHRIVDERAANAKALELLKNSPYYKEGIETARLFLQALRQRAPHLPNLIRSHLGSSLEAGESIPMSTLLTDAAPKLGEHRIDPIAALPTGNRINLDPWSDRVELEKPQAVTFAVTGEKTVFDITRLFFYLTRLQELGDKKPTLPPGKGEWRVH